MGQTEQTAREDRRAPLPPLPVQTLRFACASSGAIELPHRPGTSAGTTLAGAFGDALLEVTCARAREGLAVCEYDDGGSDGCADPARCRAPRLLRPRSAIHQHDFARPVFLRAPQLELGEPVREFELEVLLWGRRAVRSARTVQVAVQRMSRRGLLVNGRARKLRATLTTTDTAREVADTAPALPPGTERVQLRFETPVILGDEPAHEPRPLTRGEARERLIDLFGNAAYELAAWNLEDADEGEPGQRSDRDRPANALRATTRETVSALDVQHAHLHFVELGTRRSRSNRRRYPLHGLTGCADLVGDLAPVWPLLHALTLGRLGQKRSMGFGTAQLWLAGPASPR